MKNRNILNQLVNVTSFKVSVVLAGLLESFSTCRWNLMEAVIWGSEDEEDVKKIVR